MLFIDKKYAQAVEHYKAACDSYVSLQTNNPDDFGATSSFVRTLGMYAAALARTGKFEEARAAFVKTIELGDQFPDHPETQGNVIRALNNLSRMQQEDLGQLEAAETTLRDVVERCRQAVERFPQDVYLRKSQAMAWANLGAISQERGDWEQAEEYARLQLESMREALSGVPDNRDFRNQTIRSAEELAQILVRRDKLQDAFEVTGEITEIDESSAEIAYREARAFAKICIELEQWRDDPEAAELTAAQLDDMMQLAQSRALAQLRAAIDSGYNRVDAVASGDRVWESLRDLPEFRQILASMNDGGQ